MKTASVTTPVLPGFVRLFIKQKNYSGLLKAQKQPECLFTAFLTAPRLKSGNTVRLRYPHYLRTTDELIQKRNSINHVSHDISNDNEYENFDVNGTFTKMISSEERIRNASAIV